MSARRLFTSITAASCLLTAGASHAQAGCLDWLFGRSTPYVANYPVATQPSVSSYAPATVTTPTSYPIPASSAGIVAAQRPAFGTSGLVPVQTFDNPSVYTGLPVTRGSGVTANRLPLTTPTIISDAAAIPTQPTSAYRLPLTTAPATALPLQNAQRVPISSTLRGTTGVNPIIPTASYSANYGSTVSPAAMTQPVNPVYGAPLTIVPPQKERWRFGSGLARFFNSLLGRDTNYVSSYYRAPVTYYRPVSGVNPTTGSAVTVQRPCTSYVQQLQRVPYNSFLPLQPAPTTTSPPVPVQSFPTTSGVCGTPGTFAPPPVSSIPSGTSPGGIGQVGGQTVPGSPGITTIPSTVPGSSSSPGGNSMPLTGSSPPPNGSASPSDQDPVLPPSLRPPLNGSGTNNGPAENFPSEDAGTEDDDFQPGIQFFSPENGRGNGTSDPLDSDQQTRSIDSSGLMPPGGSYTSRNRASRNPATVGDGRSGAMPFPGTAERSIQYSTLQPIRRPESASQPPPFTSDSTGRTPDESNSGRSTLPSTEPLDLPPLPAPSNRAADANSLFRGNPTSTSSRFETNNRVSVPVREATARNDTARNDAVRQVAAWQEIPAERTVTRPPQIQSQPGSVTQPVRPESRRPESRRPESPWVPAR